MSASTFSLAKNPIIAIKKDGVLLNSKPAYSLDFLGTSLVLVESSPGVLTIALSNSASDLTSGTIPAARIGANTIDAITEIAAALKSGLDLKLVTGTPGGVSEVAVWNVDGDLVSSGSYIVGFTAGADDKHVIWSGGELSSGGLKTYGIYKWSLNSGSGAQNISIDQGEGIVTNRTGLVTMQMPGSGLALGDVMEVIGRGSGGWKLQVGTGQQICYNGSLTSITTGSLSSTAATDSVRLVVASSDSNYVQVVYSRGTLTVA